MSNWQLALYGTLAAMGVFALISIASSLEKIAKHLKRIADRD